MAQGRAGQPYRGAAGTGRRTWEGGRETAGAGRTAGAVRGDAGRSRDAETGGASPVAVRIFE